MASLKKKFGKISDNIDKSQERLLLRCKESDLLLINKINRISDSWFSVPDFNVRKNYQKWYRMMPTIQQINNGEKVNVKK